MINMSLLRKVKHLTIDKPTTSSDELWLALTLADSKPLTEVLADIEALTNAGLIIYNYVGERGHYVSGIRLTNKGRVGL